MIFPVTPCCRASATLVKSIPSTSGTNRAPTRRPTFTRLKGRVTLTAGLPLCRSVTRTLNQRESLSLAPPRFRPPLFRADRSRAPSSAVILPSSTSFKIRSLSSVVAISTRSPGSPPLPSPPILSVKRQPHPPQGMLGAETLRQEDFLGDLGLIVQADRQTPGVRARKGQSRPSGWKRRARSHCCDHSPVARRRTETEREGSIRGKRPPAGRLQVVRVVNTSNL